MVADSMPVDLVQSVLSLTHTVSPNKLSVVSLVRESLEECIQKLSHSEPTYVCVWGGGGLFGNQLLCG